MSKRIQQINNLLKEKLAEILHSEVEEARFGLLTVTAVETSPDLSQAKVFVSCLKNENALMKILKPKLYLIQKLLNQSVILRKVPRIFISIDKSSLHAEKIEKVLKKWEKKMNENEN